eukprot:scaffold78346_cov45-Phaeocystis_antarctica.AAC.1
MLHGRSTIRGVWPSVCEGWWALGRPVQRNVAALHASRTDSHSVLTQGNDLLDEHDVAVASVGSSGLIHARHGAFQELTTGR